jgi:hypothetical protein
MPDAMTLMVAFFHENDHLARARELREALDQFEMRMPERSIERILSKLPIEERAPSGWSRLELFRPPEILVFMAWVGNAGAKVPKSSRIGSGSVGGVWASMIICWTREMARATLAGGSVGGSQGQSI